MSTIRRIEKAGDWVRTDPAAVDPLYDKAVEVVREIQRASISLVQRSLKISYNRAAQLLEQMERAGLVSAMDSQGHRKLLKIKDETK